MRNWIATHLPPPAPRNGPRLPFRLGLFNPVVCPAGPHLCNRPLPPLSHGLEEASSLREGSEILTVNAQVGHVLHRRRSPDDTRLHRTLPGRLRGLRKLPGTV